MTGGAHDQLMRRLRRFSRRYRALHFIRGLMTGLLVGATLAITLLIIGWWLGTEAMHTLAAIAFGSTVFAWSLSGLLHEPDLLELARLVDCRADLKDRTVSALQFLGKPAPTACEQLELLDAIETIERTLPNQVLPWRLPRSTPVALVVTALALVLSVLMVWQQKEAGATPTAPPPGVLAAASEAQNLLNSLKERASEAEDRDFEKLLRDLQRLIERLETPGTDERAALETLSEVQQRLAEKAAEYQQQIPVELLDQLADAFAATPTLGDAAEALREGNYEKAAEKLRSQIKAPDQGGRTTEESGAPARKACQQ